MRIITKIIIHVSDSPDSMDIGVKEIRPWHVDPPPKGNGWKDIAYQAVVRRDGTLEIGRPYDQAGAHTKNHNSDSVGICWVGRVKYTPLQYLTLLNTTRMLMAVHGLKTTDVYGHAELNPGKSCPNLDMNQFRRDLIK